MPTTSSRETEREREGRREHEREHMREQEREARAMRLVQTGQPASGQGGVSLSRANTSSAESLAGQLSNSLYTFTREKSSVLA